MDEDEDGKCVKMTVRKHTTGRRSPGPGSEARLRGIASSTPHVRPHALHVWRGNSSRPLRCVARVRSCFVHNFRLRGSQRDTLFSALYMPL